MGYTVCRSVPYKTHKSLHVNQLDAHIFIIANWYCCEGCELEAGDDDSILLHSKALLWRGLLHMANRDAIREGDGPAILQFWKIYMPTFWNRSHYKYLIVGHLLLASKLMNMLQHCYLTNWSGLSRSYNWQ
jgi:hypothetical protein